MGWSPFLLPKIEVCSSVWIIRCMEKRRRGKNWRCRLYTRLALGVFVPVWLGYYGLSGRAKGLNQNRGIEACHEREKMAYTVVFDIESLRIARRLVVQPSLVCNYWFGVEKYHSSVCSHVLICHLRSSNKVDSIPFRGIRNSSYPAKHPSF